jgi:Fe-S oxidoreductase
MLNGHGGGPLDDGWRSTAVRDALDLCLACKDAKRTVRPMWTWPRNKAEFLAHHYQRRPWRRPRAHFSMGWLPLIAQMVGRLRAGKVVNAVTHTPVLARLATAVAGVADREIPLFAGETLQQWFQRRGSRGSGERGTVLLWPDTFTNHFHPHIGQAAIQLVEDAGWRVTLPDQPVCCGLTLISTGQVAIAKRVLRRTVGTLAPHLREGGLVLGLEPSCTAVFRSDVTDLFAEDHDVRRLAKQTITLAELLTAHSPGYEPPRVDARAIAQVHCHQHAVLGWDADKDLLAKAGVDVEQLESGCCGLAGNFGFEPGHREVSEACAERVLLPRVREADSDTVVLADGFSCRTQIHELDSGGKEGIHFAELLAASTAQRPQSPSLAAKAAVLVAAVVVARWLWKTLNS